MKVFKKLLKNTILKIEKTKKKRKGKIFVKNL